MATKAKKVVVRETAAAVFEMGRNRPVIVELHPRFLVVRLKGTRRAHEFSYDGLWWRGVQIEAEKGKE